METAAFVCEHVFSATRPVLLVSREDGDWQLLCGGEHDANERPRVVGLRHLFERDATLQEIADLPPDWDAERAAPGSPWQRRRAV